MPSPHPTGIGYEELVAATDITRPLIVIEHLEDHVSNWLALEYEHSARIAGSRLVFTNCNNRLQKLAAKLGRPCYLRSIVELNGVLWTNPQRVIILDPQASERLSVEEARRAEAIVVGGILGDHPPRGRTKKLLSDRFPQAVKRNIGRHQFSIDGAVYVALRVSGGTPLEEIPVTVGIRFEFPGPLGFKVEVELPYAYPLVDGKPLYHPRLPELLRSGLAYEEYREVMS